MDVKELLTYMHSHIDKTIDAIAYRVQIKPRIHCADGFNISVQAHDGAYCTPRVAFADWTAVECGFPSDIPSEIMDRAEDPDDPTGTVYGYVDIERVAEMLSNHGGIDYEKSPLGKFA